MITGPNTVNDGLVFGYDADDRSSRFYKGEPTTNYIYHQNPRIDTSYAPYNMASFGGTMAQNHPGALTVYNSLGGDISWYINTGVTDWTNTRHAYWVYDETLKKPVVVMNNVADTWQAKSFATGMDAWSTYGYGVGTKYTISWLQWTSNINRAVVAGLYTRNSSGGYNFFDGDTLNSPTSFNTLPYTWQRVYHTFTVTNNWDQTREYNNIFMYGMYYGSGTLKISDVQLEIKDHPTQYNNTFSRAADQTLYNLKTKTAIDLTNVSFDTTAHPVFDGTDDYIDLGSHLNSLGSAATFECIFKSINTTNLYKVLLGWGYGTTMYGGISIGDYTGEYSDESLSFTINGGFGDKMIFHVREGATKYADNDYHHVIITSGQNSYKVYIDGIEKTITFQHGSQSSNYTQIIGYNENVNSYIGKRPYPGSEGYFNGYIPVVRIYNRPLSLSEVQQNYNAYKSRFNI